MAPGVSPNADEAVTGLHVEAGEVSFHVPHSQSQRATIPQDSLRRSKLLQDLVGSTDGVSEVPIPPAALQLWLRSTRGTTIQHGSDSDPCGAESHADSASHKDGATGALAEIACAADTSQKLPDDVQLSVHDVLKLITVLPPSAFLPLAIGRGELRHLAECAMAADILIDEGTAATCARIISRQMVPGAQDHGSAVRLQEAVAGLSEHLQLAILASAPLDRCLADLPPSWHPLSLRAHHPSMDAHATLELPLLPIAQVNAALTAAATLTNLHTLSLAGLTLPRVSGPCIRELQRLPALTSLNLHDIGMRQPAAAALAAVLPTLRQLKSLNLSSNYFMAPVVASLAPALRRCTSLRTLDLWETLDLEEPDTHYLRPLGAAVGAMSQLTALAIGVGPRVNLSLQNDGYMSWDVCTDLIDTSLKRLPHLVTLKLHLCDADDLIHRAPAMLAGLAQLSQLKQFQWALPQRAQATAPVTFALTRLTSLRLDVLPVTDYYVEDASTNLGVALLAGMSRLRHLQHLWLRVPIEGSSDAATELCDALSTVLPHMSHLSHLELLAAASHVCSPVAERPAGAPLARVVEATLSVPQLQVLHVPVSARLNVQERTVAAVVEAASRMQLSVDLYIQDRADAENLLAAFVPVFPYVRALDVRCHPMRHSHLESSQVHLQPLLEGIGALTHLRELRAEGYRMDVKGSVLGSLLNSVSCLASLVHLEWCLTKYSQARLDLGEFVSGLPGLTDLTHLEIDVGANSVPEQLQLLRACTVLPQLQVLGLGTFGGWEESPCRELLTQLRLKQLHVEPPLTAAGRSRETIGAGLPLVRHLQHLRSLTFSVIIEPASVLDATAALPAFQWFRIGRE